MIRSRMEAATNEPPFVIEEVTDPIEVARSRSRHARAMKNSEWLQVHWADLLPQARGKFVAVAGQSPFIAETAADAWAWAARTHPDDDGVLVQYVWDRPGVRIYANRR